MESVIQFFKQQPLAAGLIVILALLLIFQGQESAPDTQTQQSQQAKQLSNVRASLDELPIADEQLRACITRTALEAARASANSYGAISNVGELRRLYCANHKIKTILGIEALTQLEFLDISHNQIRKLDPLASLQNLSSLNLQDNPVNDINVVQKLRSLKKIQLPNLPEHDCQDLANLLYGLESNLKHIRCYKYQAEQSQPVFTHPNTPSERQIEREIDRFEREY